METLRPCIITRWHLSDVRFEFNIDAALEKRFRRLKKDQSKLDLQVIKDSNLFCPFAEGILQSSALMNTVLGSGVVRWVTPYARRQYYELPNKSKDKNPNARIKWFEEAKARYRDDWLMIAGGKR